MIGAAALVVALTAASTDPLDAARAALANGAYAEAEVLALAAARPPRAGAALYVAGLARFRAGWPGEALEALDAAGRASDPPAPAFLQYNRGACLSELKRYREAERAFLRAARDASLAPAALVNAAYAALDRGTLKRARSLAFRARAAGAAADLVADLEAKIARPLGKQPRDGDGPALAEYRAGIEAFERQRYEEARSCFQRAAELDPTEARSRLMAGAAALELGERGEARADLEQALRLAVEDADASAARDYLDALSPGLASRGRGFEAALRAGGGFDSGAGQSRALDPQSLAPLAGGMASGTATAAMGLSYRGRLGTAVFGEVAYGLDQVAYLSPAAADYSLQNHVLLGSLEWARGRARLGASGGGQVVFTGLAAFRGLRGSALAGAWAAFDEGDWTTTRLDLGWAGSEALGGEFYYLAGNRADAALSQQVRAKALSLDASYRFRYDGMGTLQSPPGASSESCALSCIQTRSPFGYRSHAASLAGRAALGARARLELTGGIEWRSYLSHDTTTLVFKRPFDPPGRSAVFDRLRQDLRLLAALGGAVRIHRALELRARYEMTFNRSNISADSFDKHVLTLEAGYAW